MIINMNAYKTAIENLRKEPRTWLVTGVAGFIGSNLLELLLHLGQRVVGLDNFATGHQRNLDEVCSLVSIEQWRNFCFIEGDVRRLDDCRTAMVWDGFSGKVPVDYVLHQAALGSVPRSLEDPIKSNSTNVDGFLNVIVAARDAKVRSFTYAASSSTYGDHPGLPKVEEVIGSPLSPYAVTKYVNELYADVFSKCYGFKCVGLRYFNVFGKRQDPNGAYSAVIPKWTAAMIRGDEIKINGDGTTSRDFCYIDNAVQANILAAIASNESKNNIYNVAVGDRTNLVQLFDCIRAALSIYGVEYERPPNFSDFRSGDVLHSQANIGKISEHLGYRPQFKIKDGVLEAMPWYIKFVK